MKPRLDFKITVLLVASCAGLAFPALAVASDCPRLGLPSVENERFCDEFRTLLYAPFQPGGDRQVPGKPPAEIDQILRSDPLWGEVYRSDPKQTIDLIRRIRAAGGLEAQ